MKKLRLTTPLLAVYDAGAVRRVRARCSSPTATSAASRTTTAGWPGRRSCFRRAGAAARARTARSASSRATPAFTGALPHRRRRRAEGRRAARDAGDRPGSSSTAASRRFPRAARVLVGPLRLEQWDSRAQRHVPRRPRPPGRAHDAGRLLVGGERRGRAVRVGLQLLLEVVQRDRRRAGGHRRDGRRDAALPAHRDHDADRRAGALREDADGSRRLVPGPGVVETS